MPPTCTVCRHADRHAVDRELLASVPFRNIAARFGLSTGALQRHHREHLASDLVRAKDAEDLANADALLQEVRRLHQHAAGILADAEANGDGRLALSAIREARTTLELLAKLLGEIDSAPKVSISMTNDWAAVRGALLEALAPYPDARQAAAARLAGLGA